MSVIVSIFMVIALIIFTLTSSIPILFTAIPQLSSLVPSIALNIQHFLAPLMNEHFWWDMLPCCYDPHWLSNAFIYLSL